ncbi:unnamed protein product [Polarella glacialis]|uniref:Uncharacterized protein n=1 Tax=Polarella glacialis TaxID=89957 RepID=A0A813LUW0_POLGL|nr:unnamed protein product [Polarella glacialis]
MQRGHSANQHFRETLEGSQQQAKLDFEVLYEPYDTEQEPYDLPVMAKGTAAQSVAQRNAKLGTAHQGQGHQGHGHQGQYHQRHGQWHGGAAQAAPTSSMRRAPHGEQGLPDQPRTLSTRKAPD